jgi:hypothetical protein
MNILLVITRFDRGGAEQHVRELANQLALRGHTVSVMSGRGRQISQLHAAVRHISIKMSDLLLPLLIFSVIRFIRQNRIDIIHGHQRLAILTGCLAGVLTGTPMVSTVHGRTRLDLRSAVSRRLSHRILFVSRFVESHAREKYHLSGKTAYVPNAVCVGDIPDASLPHTICHFSRIDRNHFAFLTLLVRDVMPELILTYPNVQLDIVGDGQFLPALRTMVSAFNRRYQREHCRAVGYADSAHRYFAQAGLVIGVGRVAIDATAHRIPVLLANAKRMGGLLTHANYHRLSATNFVDTDAAVPRKATLVESLRTFYENYAQHRAAARTMSDCVRREFSQDLVTERTIGVYRDVLR